MLGAVVTIAKLTKDGQFLIMVESGKFCVWSLSNLSMVFKEFISEAIVDIILYEKDKKCYIVSKQGEIQKQIVIVQSRVLPSGNKQYEIQVPVLRIKPISITFEGAYLIVLAWEKKIQGILHVYHTQTGELCHKIPLKPETNVKDITNIVSITEKPYFVALLEGDKANLYDVKNKKWIKTIPSWNGVTTKNGRWGISAPTRGGLDLLDMKLDGEIVRTFMTKLALGIFSVMAMFTKVKKIKEIRKIIFLTFI